MMFRLLLIKPNAQCPVVHLAIYLNSCYSWCYNVSVYWTYWKLVVYVNTMVWRMWDLKILN